MDVMGCCDKDREDGGPVRPICFPVLEPVHFIDSFGFARSGGRRHEGTDLMGQKGFRLIAPVDGVIVDLRGPGSGHSDHSVRLRDDEGWYVGFLHMNDDSPGTDDGAAPVAQVFAPGLAVGQRVEAGQLLGYMGDSGNAEGTQPHLHFELRQPAPEFWSAAAVDPFDSLVSAPACPDLRTPTGPAVGAAFLLV
jgi:murein DD-endopeptidase MepM/ murein hydrolase activator NlpD